MMVNSSNINKKVAFVTGGTGFIGSHVIECLLKKGWHVKALTRRKHLPLFLHFPKVQWIFGNLLNREVLRKAISGCDAIFHIAADYRLWSKNPKELYKTNVDGTRNLLSLAKENEIPRVVYTSSVGALGLYKDGTPANEDTPVHLKDMIGHYKRSKFLAERVAEKYADSGLSVVIVNPSTPIGPRDHKPTPTGRIIVDFINGRMPAYVDTGLNFIHVRDVAVGHILAYEKGKTGEKYILGNRNMTLKDFFNLLSKITEIPAPRVRLPRNFVLSIAYINEVISKITHKPPAVPLEGVRMSQYLMFFDSTKAVRELGLPQTPLEKAIKEAIAWYVQAGYVQPDRLTRKLMLMQFDS